MNVVSEHFRRHNVVRRDFKAVCIVAFLAVIAVGHSYGQLTYSVTDLGTLGGSGSIASVSGDVKGSNKARMIVGSSNVSDGSEHAFLFTGGKMYDLNLLCDLSTTDFKVLTVAKTIDDCGDIIGEGIAASGDKHAFLMTPNPVDGGRWCHDCCQWVWKQDNGGWWWENNSHSYQWHGGPGSHGQCPDHPPHCWWWPLPCPDGCGCDHQCLPPEWCYCCINGVIYVRPTADCQARGGQCYPCPDEAVKNCQPCHWCCVNGKIFPSDAEQCRKKGGQCFGTEEDAIRNCKACWWCCLDGNVSQTTWADCQNKGGQCYPTEDEAKAHQKDCVACWVCIDNKPVQMSAADAGAKGLKCYPTSQDAQASCKPCWCCIRRPAGRKVVQTTQADCKQQGGQCYDSQQEAAVACQGPPPKLCWVCIDGQPTQIPQTDAAAKHLQCYPTAIAAKKSKDCAPSGGWCCVITKGDAQSGSQVFAATAAQCADKGGHFFNSQSEAMALCQGPPPQTPTPPPCWCCIQGPAGKQVIVSNLDDCERRGGRCYGSEQEAHTACAGETPPPLCWVCLNGQATQIPQADAQKRQLRCYNSHEEAAKACSEGPKIWCCIDGQVMQSTEAECRARNGQAYRSEKEARARCGSGGKCWSCVNGKVVELSQAQARGRRLPCFGSREEASANCRPKETETKCWVCINGRVGQVTEAQARARGVQCFGSREEAMQNCQGRPQQPKGPRRQR